MTEFIAIPRRQRAGRIVAVMLLAASVLGFVTTSTLRMTVVQPSFYTSALDRTRTFDRLYDEVLVDPVVARLANDLTAGQPAALAPAIGVNLRLALPPETVRAIAADQIHSVIRWLNGSVSTPRLDVSLDAILTGLRGVAAAYVSQVSGAARTLLTDSLPQFRERLTEFLGDLRDGTRERYPPILNLSPQNRAEVESLLLSHIPQSRQAAVVGEVRAALFADDFVDALTAVGIEVVASAARAAGTDLTRIADGRTWSLGPVVKQGLGPDAVRTIKQVRWWLQTPLQLIFYASIIVGLLILGVLAWLLPSPTTRQRVIAIVVGLGAGTGAAAVLGLFVWLRLSDLTGSLPIPAGWPQSVRHLLHDNARTAQSALVRTWFMITAAVGASASAIALGAVAAVVRRDAPHRRDTRAGRRSGLAHVTMLGTRAGMTAIPLVVAVLAVCLVAAAATTAPRPRCNGATYLCDRHYDDVVSLATHNAMANTQDRFYFPLQDVGIDTQLDAGARALQLDSWTWETPVRVASRLHSAGFTPNVVAAVSNAVARVDPPRPGVWLCHGLCQLGATPMVSALEGLRRWLDRNPREVVTVILQDETPPTLTTRSFEQAGLVPYLADPPADPAGSWPTLGQLISSGHRLVAFTENAHNAAPWLQNFYKYGEETPFSFRTASDMAKDSGCIAHRGGAGKQLFLLNHFVTPASGSRAASAEVNSTAFLAARVQRCAAVRGRFPTVIAVDFASLGQGQSVVDRLNRER